MLALLEAHPHIVMDESFDGSEDRLEEPDAEEGEARVWGNMVAFLERLDDELFKSLQARLLYIWSMFAGCGGMAGQRVALEDMRLLQHSSAR